MRISPSLDEVLAHDGPHSHVALTITLLADTLTPISVFHALSGDQPRGFLLESVVGGETLSRWSFIGADVRTHIVLDQGTATLTRLCEGGREVVQIPYTDPLQILRDEIGGVRLWAPDPLPRFPGGAVGYLGFDCITAFEDRVSLPQAPGLGAPAGELLLTDALAAYDHARRRLVLVVHAPLSGDRESHYRRAVERLHAMVGRLATRRSPPEAPWSLPGPLPPPADALPIQANRTRADMEAAVEEARVAITEGEIFQVVLSQRLSVPVRLDPLLLYRALRAIDPSPYMFLLKLGERSLVGASPEVLVRVDADGKLLVRPIAGTRRRGDSDDADQALARELLADAKELAEHRMLLDLGRNDLGRVAAPGTVRVDDREHIERYAHVMHIVSDVHAELEPGRDALDALRACFPAGTVSGAPKVRACELIARLEPDRRGPYAGAVGYFGVDGSLDTAIAIRTLVVDEAGVHVQAGAGIVHDSVPEREHQECLNKALGCLRAVQLALHREAS